jgi:FLVCR family MFS transporter 7
MAQSACQGFFGAALIISGLVAAFITAPVFDKVLKRHLAITAKVLLPVIGVSGLDVVSRRCFLLIPSVQICYLGLIFAVKPDSNGAIYALVVLVSLLATPPSRSSLTSPT